MWCCWSIVGALASGGAATAHAHANWTTYEGNDWNQRWSTLEQTNAKNVASQVPRLVFQAGT